MKIKRTSWHYKISNLLTTYEKDYDNLCIYFWRLVGTCALSLFGISLICVLLYEYFTSHIWISNTIFILWLLLSIVLPLLIIRFLRKKVGKLPKASFENIVLEYIKAKKEKVCPIIEYV